MANEDLENGTQILDESSLHKMRDLKRKVSGKLLTLFEAISSPIPSKRATAQDEALSTYQILVKSYIPSLWTGNEISPRELAVHGWKCIGKNKAKCISCGRLLYTTVPRITEVNIDVYNKCLKRVRDHIVISHELTCIYRSAYIDFHLKLNNACAVKEIIKERLETYHIADLNLKIPSDITISDSVFPANKKEHIICACLGWAIKINSIESNAVYFASCEMCAKMLIICSEIPLDVINAHRKWCPILDINSNGVPYWKIAFDLISDSRSKESRPSVIPKDTSSVIKTLNRSISVVSSNGI